MSWRLQARSRIMRFDEVLQRLVFSDITYVDGKPKMTLLAAEPFRANVQPLKGRELLLVPEHQRFTEQYWAYTQDRTFEKTGETVRRAQPGDTPVFVHFQVQEVEHWGSYQRVRIMRVDVGPYQTP